MEQNETLENSLFETLTDNSIELSGEIGELTIDQFIENDFLKEIPFFSIFYKSLKTVKGLREALFAMKVYKFIREFQTIKDSEKEKFIQKITIDKKEKTKIGQTLIMILERIDDLDKTVIIANLFAAYLEEKITNYEFVQLCSIVQNSYIGYLNSFFKMKKTEDLSRDIESSLSAWGLLLPLIIDTKSMYGEKGIIDKNDYHLVYVVSKIGMKMRKYGFREMPSS